MSIELNSIIHEKMQIHAQEQYVQYVIEYLDRNMGDAIEFFGEYALRKTIEVGRERAKVYGITNPRDLCLYVYMMCTSMGSFFDEDPLYPWAKEILLDKHLAANQKVDKLIDASLSFVKDLSDEERKRTTMEQINLVRTEAFFKLNKDQDAFEQVSDLLKNTNHYKIKQTTSQNYSIFTEKNILLAQKYGIQQPTNQAALIGLSFFSGYGIFLDPRFLKVREAFLDKQISEEDKIQLVQTTVQTQLKKKLQYFRETI